MGLPILDDAGFKSQVLEGAGTFVVDFFAEWCGPCRGVGQMLEAIQPDYAGVSFVKVDIDQAPDTAVQYGITSIPQVAVFKDGQEQARIVGGQPERKFRQLIDEHK